MHRLLAERRGVSAGGCWGRGQKSAALAAGFIGLGLAAALFAGCDPGPKTGPGLDPPHGARGLVGLPSVSGSGGSAMFGNPAGTPSGAGGAGASNDAEGPKGGAGMGGQMMSSGSGGSTSVPMDNPGTSADGGTTPGGLGTCPSGTRYPTQLAVHIALDESMAMMVPFDTWTPLTGALEGWIDAQPDTQLSVQMFASTCSLRAYVLPTLELAPASSQKGALETRMGASMHELGAATAPALQGVVGQASTWSETGAGNAAVVLISSSEPNACSGDAGASAAMIAAQGMSHVPAVPTYVLALQGHATLDAIAQAGGTGAAHAVEDPRSQESLMQALQAITDEARCRYALPAEVIPLAQDQLALELTVEGVTTRVSRVASEADCASVSDGFYYDDPSAPRFAIACPQTCARGGTVQFAPGCQ
jgi:hypothetical protein